MNKYLKLVIKSQSGYASFVITLVVMILVSLIVVAFATISRQEQKDALSNELATQAYYAAESGINDAYAAVASDIISGTSVPPTASGNCLNTYADSTTSQLNGTNIQYNCLIVNPNPNSLSYQQVEPGQGEVIPILSKSAIASLTISWQYYQTSVSGLPLSFLNCPSNTNQPDATLPASVNYTPGNCGAGVLQLDLLSSTDLAHELVIKPYSSRATTVFLEPTKAGPTVSTAISQNKVFYVRCNLSSVYTYDCGKTLSVAITANRPYYIHLQSFYMSNNVDITAQAPRGGGNVAMTGAQVLIDSTGEAGGQLKRIQERVCDDIYCNSAIPDSAIESTDCINKQFGVYPGESGAALTPSKPLGC